MHSQRVFGFCFFIAFDSPACESRGVFLSLQCFSTLRFAPAFRSLDLRGFLFIFAETHFNAPNSGYLSRDDKLYYPAAKVPKIGRNEKNNSKRKNIIKIKTFFLVIKKYVVYL